MHSSVYCQATAALSQFGMTTGPGRDIEHRTSEWLTMRIRKQEC